MVSTHTCIYNIETNYIHSCPMHIYARVVEMVFITLLVNFSVLLEYGLTSICELLIGLKQ